MHAATPALATTSGTSVPALPHKVAGKVPPYCARPTPGLLCSPAQAPSFPWRTHARDAVRVLLLLQSRPRGCSLLPLSVQRCACAGQLLPRRRQRPQLLAQRARIALRGRRARCRPAQLVPRGLQRACARPGVRERGAGGDKLLLQ
eukprot:362156-Chlamydomonas_euryale.AAC.1